MIRAFATVAILAGFAGIATSAPDATAVTLAYRYQAGQSFEASQTRELEHRVAGDGSVPETSAKRVQRESWLERVIEVDAEGRPRQLDRHYTEASVVIPGDSQPEPCPAPTHRGEIIRFERGESGAWHCGNATGFLSETDAAALAAEIHWEQWIPAGDYAGEPAELVDFPLLSILQFAPERYRVDAESATLRMVSLADGKAILRLEAETTASLAADDSASVIADLQATLTFDVAGGAWTSAEYQGGWDCRSSADNAPATRQTLRFQGSWRAERQP